MMPAGLETEKMRKYFHLVLYQYHTKTSILSFQIWAPLGEAMLVRSLPIKSRKRLAYSNACHTFTTHSCRVYGITYTGCWAQNGNTQSCFHNPKAPNFNKQGEKLSEKVLCVYFFLNPLLSIQLVLLLPFGSPLNKVINARAGKCDS